MQLEETGISRSCRSEVLPFTHFAVTTQIGVISRRNQTMRGRVENAPVRSAQGVFVDAAGYIGSLGMQ